MSVEPWIDAWPRSAMIPPPGPAHVAEQELDDGRRADVLHAHRVLRPADRVDEGAGALAPRVLAERLGHLAGRARFGTPQVSSTSSGV